MRDVVVLEATRNIGGLSQSVEYKGNRIDIGGHRFFSKSDWVMDWWTRMLPLAASASQDPGDRDLVLAYQGKQRDAAARPPRRSETDARVMLVRKRLSRIYFDGKFFDYPAEGERRDRAQARPVALRAVRRELRLGDAVPAPARAQPRGLLHQPLRPPACTCSSSRNTRRRSGARPATRSARSGARSASRACPSPRRCCTRSSSRFAAASGLGAAQQTSLIERFLYPKYGPGLMWETTAEQLRARGVRLAVRGARDAASSRPKAASARCRCAAPTAAGSATRPTASSRPCRCATWCSASRRARRRARARSRPASSTAISSPSACSTGG